MAMYGIEILPLITRLHNDSLTQKWYTAEGSVVGKLKNIRALIDKLTQLGPKYRYLVNPPKCQLIIKPGGERHESTVFAGTKLVIAQCARILESIIGSSKASKFFLKDAEIKFTKFWTDLVSLLSPLHRMPMHVWRRGLNRNWATSRVLQLPWTGFWATWMSSLAKSYQTSSAKKIFQEEITFFLSLSEWVGSTLPSHMMLIKIVSNQLNSQVHWRNSIFIHSKFNNVNKNKPRSVSDRKQTCNVKSSRKNSDLKTIYQKWRILSSRPRRKEHLSGLTRFRYQNMVLTSRRLSSVTE